MYVRRFTTRGLVIENFGLIDCIDVHVADTSSKPNWFYEAVQQHER